MPVHTRKVCQTDPNRSVPERAGAPQPRNRRARSRSPGRHQARRQRPPPAPAASARRQHPPPAPAASTRRQHPPPAPAASTRARRQHPHAHRPPHRPPFRPSLSWWPAGAPMLVQHAHAHACHGHAQGTSARLAAATAALRQHEADCTGPPTRAPPRHHSRSPGSPPPPELTSTCAGGAGPGRPWPPDDLEPTEAVGDSVKSDLVGPGHLGWMDEEKGRVWRGEACEVAGRAVGGGSRTRPGRVPAPSGSRRQGVSHSSSTAARPLITRHTGQPPPSPSRSNLRPIWDWLVV